MTTGYLTRMGRTAPPRELVCVHSIAGEVLDTHYPADILDRLEAATGIECVVWRGETMFEYLMRRAARRREAAL